jgi:hypothetical protein
VYCAGSRRRISDNKAFQWSEWLSQGCGASYGTGHEAKERNAAGVCRGITGTEETVQIAPKHQHTGNSTIMRKFPNLEKCIISYQKVLRSALENVNH